MCGAPGLETAGVPVPVPAPDLQARSLYHLESADTDEVEVPVRNGTDAILFAFSEPTANANFDLDCDALLELLDECGEADLSAEGAASQGNAQVSVAAVAEHCGARARNRCPQVSEVRASDSTY